MVASSATVQVQVVDVSNVADVKIATSSGVSTKIVTSWTSSSAGSSNVSIQRIESFSLKIYRFEIRTLRLLLSHLSAIHVEPPVTDEVLLVEKGAVGAEEAVLKKPRIAIICTNMECLAIRFWVSVVPFDSGITEERGLWRVYKDGVVLAGNTRNILGCKMN